jgi:hypothetical protein
MSPVVAIDCTPEIMSPVVAIDCTPGIRPVVGRGDAEGVDALQSAVAGAVAKAGAPAGADRCPNIFRDTIAANTEQRGKDEQSKIHDQLQFEGLEGSEMLAGRTNHRSHF